MLRGVLATSGSQKSGRRDTDSLASVIVGSVVGGVAAFVIGTDQ